MSTDDRAIQIETGMSVIVPMTPNFIKIDCIEGGPQVETSLPIRMFDDEALRKIGEQWTEDLVDKAKAMAGDHAAKIKGEASAK